LGGAAAASFLLGPESQEKFVRYLPADAPLHSAGPRMRSFVNFVTYGLGLLLAILVLGILLGDKTDVTNLVYPAAGFVSSAVVGGLRLDGAFHARGGGGVAGLVASANVTADNVTDEEIRGNIVVGSLLMLVGIVFLVDVAFRANHLARVADCIFHPFVTCEPSGVLLSAQLLMSYGVMTFYWLAILEDPR